MSTPTAATAPAPPPGQVPSAVAGQQAGPLARSAGDGGQPGPTQAAAPEPGPSGRLGALAFWAREALAETPGRMRGVGALAVIVALAFGLAAGQAFRSADGALHRAGANTDQLVRIQAIQTHMIQADADATNAFLVGGLEPPAQRADYAAAITSASQLIAEAAQNQPADGRALGALNQALVAYTAEIEQARANNRQALPIGAQYLKDASAHLRSDALPLLKNLADANTQRVTLEFDNAGRASLWLVTFGLLALVVLVLGLVWLARRTRRYVNVPMAGAALIVLVTLVVGLIGLAGVSRQVSSTRDGAYAATLSTAKARIAGFDAKSNESLTLIARGSGAAFEKAWKASDATVKTEIGQLGANPASSNLDALPWAPYATVHQQIRTLDDSGNWDAAVKLATGTAASTGNATFATFNKTSGAQLDNLSQQTSTQLDQAGGWLPFAGVVGVLAGLLAAILAWWGVSLRLEEYR